ncbi:hypothetical protein M434DRAFT_391643, partial [Hypoxylon sp. CO27-5]
MMEQTTTKVQTIQTKPIPIPTSGKNAKILPELPLFTLLEPASPTLSDCESALDEDENAYDMYHRPCHHRRNALSFEDGFEFPVFLRRKMSEPRL